MVQALREIIELSEFDEASLKEALSSFRCVDPEEASAQDVMRFLSEDAVDMERKGTTRTYLILNDESWAEGEVRIDGYFSIALKVLFFSKDIDAGLLEGMTNGWKHTGIRSGAPASSYAVWQSVIRTRPSLLRSPGRFYFKIALT